MMPDSGAGPGRDASRDAETRCEPQTGSGWMSCFFLSGAGPTKHLHPQTLGGGGGVKGTLYSAAKPFWGVPPIQIGQVEATAQRELVCELMKDALASSGECFSCAVREKHAKRGSFIGMWWNSGASCLRVSFFRQFHRETNSCLG